MTSLVPANDLVEEGLEEAGLVGHAVPPQGGGGGGALLLQGGLDHCRLLPAVHWRGRES